MKTLLALALALLPASLAAQDAAPAPPPVVLAEMGEADGPPPARAEAWPDEVLELAATLAVQDGGRIKPLSTFAGFTMLEINGKRGLTVTRTVDGVTVEEHLGPVEWFLDNLLFPEQARSYDTFLIEDDDVLDRIGLVPPPGKKKRDRYSFEFLLPAADPLADLANRYLRVPEKQRTPLQGHVVRLAQNFFRFHDLFYRWEGFRLVPPPLGEAEWLTIPGLVERLARSAGDELAGQRPVQARVEALVHARGDRAAFTTELAALHQDLKGLAVARGEYDKIELEDRYYKADFFFRAQWLFVVGFLLCAFVWLKPSSRRLYRVAFWWQTIPLALLATGIVVRCILRGRPPVSTLYETILFITSVGVLAALIAERLNRQRVALGLAAILGAVGLFFAGWYEEASRADTMPQLQAVLDTNFWLSTHVTTITIGYSAGLLAAAIAHVYVLGKLFGLRRGDPGFYRGIARMVYGVVCFGLLFSTVGTILGGVWANDSWGRFWGWDPKENGALMIVLASLSILHGRLGGFLRDFGVCLASLFLGTIVAFSWFHTNLLGVGLHSYGFDSRLHTLVWSFYSVEWSVLGLGVVAWTIERSRAASAIHAGAAAEPRPRGAKLVDDAG